METQYIENDEHPVQSKQISHGGGVFDPVNYLAAII